MAMRIVPAALAKVNPSLSGPKVLKSVSFVSGAMMLGDLGCQAMESFDDARSAFAWDHLRTMRMGITGAFVLTPMSLSWNMFAERLAPGKSLRAIVTKLMISIAVLPPMVAAQFASLTLLEEGKTMDDVRRQLSRDLLPTLKNGLCYWPLVGVLNSAFVPVMSRPSFSSFAGVFWNVYISYQANHNGMEVGEISVVYPLTEADSARADRRLAIEAAAPAVVASAGERGGSGSISVDGGGATTTTAAAGKAAASGEDGGSATGLQGRKKKNGKIVRRTSVVSM